MENNEREYQEKYKELYLSVSNDLKNFFKDGESPDYYGLLGLVFSQMSIKNYIICGMEKEFFYDRCEEMKSFFDSLYDEYHMNRKSQPIFSDGLRKAMEPFKDRDVSDCLQDPEFYKALLKHGGSSDKEAEEIMASIKDGKI